MIFFCNIPANQKFFLPMGLALLPGSGWRARQAGQRRAWSPRTSRFTQSPQNRAHVQRVNSQFAVQ